MNLAYYLYQCPNCGNFFVKIGISGGNIIGEKMYSDGKRIYPMLPEFPDLTKCKKCDTIIWLSKIKELEEDPWGLEMRDGWKYFERAEFLGIMDYFRALDSGIAKDRDDKLFIRLRIFWAYNDRITNGKPIFEDTNDELRWRDNAEKLLLLLDRARKEEKIIAAEINT